MSPLGCIILSMVTSGVGAEVVKMAYGGGNIKVGGGFSSDKQQVVPQTCYNATVGSVSGQEGFAQLGASQSFSELEKVLGASASAGVAFWSFSAEARASYLRSVRDRDYSISLNYYQYGRNKVDVQLLGHGEGALLESFRGFYDGGKNPYFGVFCGDHYIGSYLQGAVLTMGLNIRFGSSAAKTEFSSRAGATFGDIASAAASVKGVAAEYKMKGSVTIHAFQMGGEPSQLAHVLSNDSSGQYYALACSLAGMDKCVRAASGLLHYAKYKFSKQFSTVNNTGLTPLGIAFADFIPIEYVGLTPPASLVTPKVQQCREDLYDKLKENEYYRQKLYPFLNDGYPVELDAEFLRKVRSLSSKANGNIAVLMQPHGGAADCYNFPHKCESVKAGIETRLQIITAKDLQFLEVLKYTLIIRGGMLYNTARCSPWDTDKTKWLPVPDNYPEKESIFALSTVKLINRSYEYLTRNLVPDTSGWYDYWYVGYLNEVPMDGVWTFLGKLLYGRYNEQWTDSEENYPEYMQISPFFFDVYNNTKQRQHYYKMNKKLLFKKFNNFV